MSQEEREAWERVEEALTELGKMVVKICRAVADAIAKAMKPYLDAIIEFLQTRVKNAPPRVVYLAFHHKKRRIRKKNFARMLSYD